MPKLLQISIGLGLSIGKISQAIGEKAMGYGWESWMTYCARSRTSKPQLKTIKSNVIKVTSTLDSYMHYACFRLFDNEGLASKRASRKFVEKIKEINPDIIQLHNIHDHWLNYPILFEYLSTIDTPVVWVQHDCWAFTGGCMYFDNIGCDKWKTGCIGCPDKRAILINQAERNFKLKKGLLSNIKNLTFVPVSDWIGDMLRESTQKDRPIITIHNGIDLTKFKPIGGKINDGRFRIIGVAAVWSERKGLGDFVKLRSMLSDDYEITLVGLPQKQIDKLPAGIKGLKRTNSIEELAELYSQSDVYVLPTYSDNFPTTNLEALACGTPVITYNTGGSPEAVDNKTGVVVEQGNVVALANAIMQMNDSPLSSDACRKRAEELFDKDKCFEAYIQLFNRLLQDKQCLH